MRSLQFTTNQPLIKPLIYPNYSYHQPSLAPALFPKYGNLKNWEWFHNMWIILPIIYGKFMFQTTNQTCLPITMLTCSSWLHRQTITRHLTGGHENGENLKNTHCNMYIYIYRKNEDEPGDFRVSYFQTNPYESSHSTACQPCNATHLFFLAISLENVSFAMFHTHNFSI